MPIGRDRAPGRGQRGLTLVELVVAIVLIGVAAASLVGAFGQLSGRSADPLLQRQALALAESLLAEVMAQGVAATDPDGGAEAAGPEGGEARGSATAPFDHVNDYDGYDATGATTLDGTPVPGLEAYRLRVAVAAQSVGGVPADRGWWVQVRVTDPAGRDLLLAGWRARLVP